MPRAGLSLTRYEELSMTALSFLREEGAWRSRKLRYYGGDWPSIQRILPEFDLRPFTAGADLPGNPFLQAVIRRQKPLPVATVSHNYSLVSHRTVAALCSDGIIGVGFKPADLRYEVGLSELGEWMEFRIYFPGSQSFKDKYGYKLDLRLECFNSVDGWHRLIILFGWYRVVCSNGLIIGDTSIHIDQRHGKRLELKELPEQFKLALTAVEADRIRMRKWQAEMIAIADVETWANTKLSTDWAKKAAARVYHICDAGKDVEFDDPFASGEATSKPIRYLGRVPGCPERALTKYDVAQAMSFVATQRNNVEERLNWQTAIPDLLDGLAYTQ
jgi:Domain of unknown function (DUF932)